MNRKSGAARSLSAHSFTEKQGQYLAFIYTYSHMFRRPPAETDMQRHFEVSPPSVHQMVVTLERNGLIRRQPGVAGAPILPGPSLKVRRAARQRYSEGAIDFLNVITTQAQLLQSENDLADSDTQIATDLVNLYRALGGGWEAADVAYHADGTARQNIARP